MYASMLWFFLIGAVLPVLVYFAAKKFPQNKILGKVSVCQISQQCNGLTEISDPHAGDICVDILHPTSYCSELHLVGPRRSRIQHVYQASLPCLVVEIQLLAFRRIGYWTGNYDFPRLLLSDLSRRVPELVGK